MSIWGSKTFFASCDVDLDLKVYVGSLVVRGAGGARAPSEQQGLCECYASLQVWDGGLPLHPLARSTGLGHATPAAGRAGVGSSAEEDETTGSPSPSSSASPALPSTFSAAAARVTWGEWVTLPIKIRELPQTAQLVVRLWSVRNDCFAGCTVRLFDARLALRRGHTPLTVWRTGFTLDRLAPLVDPATDTPLALLLRHDDASPLVKALERHMTGETPLCPWTDRIVFAQLHRDLVRRLAPGEAGETDDEARVRAAIKALPLLPSSAPALTDGAVVTTPSPPFPSYRYRSAADALILGDGELHFPLFAHPVLWEDSVYVGVDGSSARGAGGGGAAGPGAGGGASGGSSSGSASGAGGGAGGPLSLASLEDGRRGAPPLIVTPTAAASLAAAAVASSTFGAGGDAASDPSLLAAVAAASPSAYWSEQLCVIADPEEDGELDNPADSKYHKLARGGVNEQTDPTLKPNRAELARLQAILGAQDFGVKLSPEARDLVWKFRYALTGSKKGALPLVSAVDWEDEEESREASHLLARWAPIDIEDALRLLCPEFTAPTVRRFAVAALRHASDSDLSLFLLQLVQALRYEPQLLLTRAQQQQQDVVAAAATAGDAADGEGGASGASEDKGAAAVAASSAAAAASPQAATPAAAAASQTAVGASRLSPLADFLLERCSASLELGMYLHWYLRVGEQDAKLGALFSHVHTTFLEGLSATAVGTAVAEVIRLQDHFIRRISAAAAEATSVKRDRVETKIEKLNKLLVSGTAYDDIVDLPLPIPFPLSPAILVAGIVPRGAHMFKSALYPTVITLKVHPESRIAWVGAGRAGTAAGSAFLQAAQAQAELEARGGAAGGAGGGGGGGAGGRAGGSTALSTSAASSSLPFVSPSSICGLALNEVAVKAATDALLGVGGGHGHGGGHDQQHTMRSPAKGGGGGSSGGAQSSSSSSSSSSVAGVASPARPTSLHRGAPHGGAGPPSSSAATTVADVAEAVASAMPPGVPPATYRVIFKNGDDMRQDQLIIQMVRLMDAQLKRVGLDLCLTPYAVLATSMTSGVMEMVLDSLPVSAVMEKYPRSNPVQAFLREKHPDDTAEYGIDPEVMDTYVKSCAGYCVITYLLGIGDRHLDNIMLRGDGHLFHLDFGYIFGRDPKPLPPPMRITMEMIDGMGGPQSANYSRFKNYCCQAYNILRRSATLVTVLLTLMRDAGIEDLHPDPLTTIAKLHEKFRVDIDDEAADAVFLRLVDDSVAAMFPAFLEVLHKIRVAMR
jgi:hypothetical protein